MEAHELLDLEREAWGALSTSGEAAASFYGAVLADDVLMLLPGGMVIEGRDAAIASMRGAPWDEHRLSDEQVHVLTADSAVVAYRAQARRGEMDYDALFTSTYVRAGEHWKLAVHQQTPL